MGSVPVVVINDLQNLKEFVVKRGEIFAGRPNNQSFDLFNDGKFGILNSTGALWSEQRRFALHALRDFGFGKPIMQEKIMEQVEKMEEHIQSYFDQQTNSNENGAIIDPQEPLQLAIGNIIMSALFGDTFDREDTKEFDYLVEAFRREMHRRNEIGEDLSSFTEWQLKVVLGDLYVAGMETTVTTIRWGIIFLLHNPDVQHKIHQEIDSVVRKGERIEMVDRTKMPYICATITEVQRLANIVAFNIPHDTIKEVTMGGYNLPVGTVVIPQMASVHLDPQIFPNPEEFNPDRFIDSNDPTINRVDAVMPFSMGKRQCPGESLARMELFLIFSNLLHKYILKPVDGKLPSLKGNQQLTFVPQSFKCVFLKR